MAFTPQIHKAVKSTVKLKIGIQGPSGSGKTLGALALATNLVPGGKVLLVDTEHGSASLYADKYNFDTIPLAPPFLSTSYQACIDAAVAAKYDVLVIDSITHQWDGDGGILRRKEAVDERGGNQWTNWKPFTEEHSKFREKIIQAPIHIICTMRSKTEYVLESNDKGKQVPKKVGSAPIQKPEMEYEFSIVFDVQMDHRGALSKNRTGLFEGQLVNLCDPKTAESLRVWMDSGEAPAPVTAPDPPPDSTPAAPTAPFAYSHGVMNCTIVDAKHFPEKDGKKEFCGITTNAPAPIPNKMSCFHASLFPCLSSLKKGERVIFAVKENGKYLTIEDVKYIGNQEYKKGAPVTTPPPATEQAPSPADEKGPF